MRFALCALCLLARVATAAWTPQHMNAGLKRAHRTLATRRCLASRRRRISSASVSCGPGSGWRIAKTSRQPHEPHLQPHLHSASPALLEDHHHLAVCYHVAAIRRQGVMPFYPPVQPGSTRSPYPPALVKRSDHLCKLAYGTLAMPWLAQGSSPAACGTRCKAVCVSLVLFLSCFLSAGSLRLCFPISSYIRLLFFRARRFVFVARLGRPKAPPARLGLVT